jgi:hypothetical protein
MGAFSQQASEQKSNLLSTSKCSDYVSVNKVENATGFYPNYALSINSTLSLVQTVLQDTVP